MSDVQTHDPQPTLQFGRFTIAVVDIALLDLLEKNARFMRNETFRRLVENIKEDGQLSQIPFCVQKPDGRYTVLSGNHRVQAARVAGLTTIPIIFTTDALDSQKALAIQLSHNSITGEDDPVILKELWDELSDVKLKMYSGLDDKSLNLLLTTNMPALADVKLDFRTTTFMFLPEEVDQVRDAFKHASALAKTDQAFVARFSDYDRLLDALAEVSGAFDVQNVAVALLTILTIYERHREDVVDGWYDPEGEKAKHKGWVPIVPIFGNNPNMPASAALVVKQALAKMVEREQVNPQQRWQALEQWAAEYLAGE